MFNYKKLIFKKKYVYKMSNNLFSIRQLQLLFQLRKRTIERKNSREGILNSISLSKKNETNSNGQTDNKGEFDDLISALRTGDVFGEDIAKFKRSKRRPVTPSGQESRRHSTHKEDSRERH